MTSARLAVLERVADVILGLPDDGTVRVGIDGVDGAGKTTFADELCHILAPSGRPVIRATIDRFHNPKSVRYRLGRWSPEGFFRDSYDYGTLKAVLLDPMGPGGSGRFRREAFDVDADTAVGGAEEDVVPRSILVFDGMFLHRPELCGYWDLSVFLRVEWVRNHRLRTRPPTEHAVDPLEPRHYRYFEGQNIYFRECRPWECASIVIDNDDVDHPFIVQR